MKRMSEAERDTRIENKKTRDKETAINFHLKEGTVTE